MNPCKDIVSSSKRVSIKYVSRWDEAAVRVV